MSSVSRLLRLDTSVCPISDRSYPTNSCPVGSCLHNLNGGCRFEQRDSISDIQTPNSRMARTLSEFATSQASMKQAIRSINLALVCNSYSKYLLEKPLAELTDLEFQKLLNSSDSYSSWSGVVPPRKRRVNTEAASQEETEDDDGFDTELASNASAPGAGKRVKARKGKPSFRVFCLYLKDFQCRLRQIYPQR